MPKAAMSYGPMVARTDIPKSSKSKTYFNQLYISVSITMSKTSHLPSKVYQDDFSPARGNALQAAVASIFGLALQDVPNFIDAPEGYDASIRSFYQRIISHDGEDDRVGLCTKIQLEQSSNSDNNLYREKKAKEEGQDEKYTNKLDGFVDKICILRGKSPRGNFGHVVVARYKEGGKFEMIHDPHPPQNTFLDKSEGFGWCMFFT